MSATFVGVLGICVIFLLLAIRVPIAFALGSVSIAGIWALRGERAALGLIGSIPHDFTASWELSAIPMFLLMGSVAFRTGLTQSLFGAARLWLSGMPGGLAVATNFSAAGFAAASGSSVATSAAIGRLAIPEMLKHGYDKALATGTVAASGTLGALIPPSIAFVIYGWFTEQSVGRLLIAGLVPGILTALVYAAMIIARCAVNPSLAPDSHVRASLREKAEALLDVWPVPMLIAGVVGSIYVGIATPTEAGALGALIAFVIGGFRGNLTLGTVKEIVVDTLMTSSSLFFLAIGAVLLTRFLAMAGIPTEIADFVSSQNFGPVALVLALIVVYLVLGMFLDPIGLMLLTLPVFLPAFKALSIDLIWIGVIVVKMIEIGLLTPPVGLNVYVVKGVCGDTVALSTVFRGVAWFLACEIIIMALLITFPQVTLWLPSLMLGS